MAGFQQAPVQFFSGFGVPGEFYDDGPQRTEPFLLQSSDATQNLFGRAYTVVSQGIAQVGNPTTTGIFAGYLVNPKAHASFGTLSGGPLAATLALQNNVDAEFCIFGSIIVSLPASANIGDHVVYDNTTGALSTVAPNVSIPSGKSDGFATVRRFTISGSSLAVIDINYTPFGG